MERLTVLCFAGTYGLALASELARFVVRGAARWYLTVALTALAWLVQTVYLVNLARASRTIPVTTRFESLLVLSWIFAAIGLYLMVRAPRPVAVGTFILPMVVALAALAGTSAPLREGWLGDWGGATFFWGWVHGLFLLGGAVSTCVAFAACLMYLAQSNRLKRKRPARLGFGLPSLEQSERINRGAITLAFPLLTFGLLIGVVLSLAARGTALRWTDPKAVSALAMWLAFALLLHARFRPSMRGRGVMLLTVVAFAFLVFTWVGVELLRLPTAHGARRTSQHHSAPEPAAPAAGEGGLKITAVGVDYRSAPASVREALAFDGPKCAQGLDALARAFPVCEFVVLSTCNRVEVYAAGEPEAVPTTGALTAFLADFHAAPAETFSGHLVSYHDEGAVGHLFRVAASLESLVLGEGQILGQVREAFRAAKDRATLGPVLHKVFENALRVGKKVREDTGMDQGKLSVASVAVDVAREVFDTFAEKTVLVIGAGKMGDLTLQHLKTLRPGTILVTNRSPERAETAASRWGGRAVPFEQLNRALIDADLVISTTAADEPVVTYDQYARVQRARRNRLALILDIAIPRDFDPRVGDLDQVLLYNVDDLRAQSEANRQRRQKGVDPALAIIERETTACYGALRHQKQAGAVLRQLGDHADGLRQQELDALYNACPELTPEQKAAIAHMAQRLQNKFLHHPRAALRSAASEPGREPPHTLLNAVRHLFGLAEG